MLRPRVLNVWDDDYDHATHLKARGQSPSGDESSGSATSSPSSSSSPMREPERESRSMTTPTLTVPNGYVTPTSRGQIRGANAALRLPEESENDTGDDEDQPPPAKRRGPARRDSEASSSPPLKAVDGGPKTARTEILRLRKEAQQLQDTADQLRQRRALVETSQSKWQRLALHQSTQRTLLMQENRKLKRAVEEQERFAQELLRLLQTPMPVMSSLGTFEENEWKLGILCANHTRREYNARRIMDKMLQDLPGYAIMSDLVDIDDDCRYCKHDNLEALDKTTLVQVNYCRRLPGNFVAVAERLWRQRLGTIRTGDGIVSTYHLNEKFDDDFFYSASKLHTRHGITSRTTSCQLHRRIVEEDRVLMCWKSVEDETIPLSRNRLVGAADGWMSLERQPRDQYGNEWCLLKCSSWVEMSPVMEHMDYLVDVMNRLRLAESPTASLHQSSTHSNQRPLISPSYQMTEPTSRKRDRHHSILEMKDHIVSFITELLWKGGDYLERVAASPPSEFCVDLAVLHALDLRNPCAIRSCDHAFSPVVTMHVDGQLVLTVEASRHGANHTAFPRLQTRHRVPNAKAALHVTVFVRCLSTSPPSLLRVGELDELELTIPPESPEISRFFPVLRDTRTQRFAVGKLKLSLQYHEPEPTPPAPRRAPLDLASALQLQRQKLRPTASASPESLDSKRDGDEAEAEAEARLCRQQLDELRDAMARDGLLLSVEDLELREPIGDGAHATVFRARRRHLSNDRHGRGEGEGDSSDVAVKQFRYQPRGVDRLPPTRVLAAFRREIETMRTLHDVSDGLVRLQGVVLSPTLAIVTELCDGGSLAQCMQDSAGWRRVAFTTKLAIATQIASGLAALHARSVLHRDLKPHNVMLSGLHAAGGAGATAKIGDLGSAVVCATRVFDEIGSSGYTAPEVFLASGYDTRADVWSLGVVLWELLADADGPRQPNPFVGRAGDDVLRLVRDGVRPRFTGTPGALSALVQACWEEDPARRPAASDVARALQGVSASLTSVSV
ncbi:hypothetical protein ATCC90586_004090 [Pythium insidiosum]|nr:hypothetical protein ATCC90586_004090 [Pythium insidiosum]